MLLRILYSEEICKSTMARGRIVDRSALIGDIRLYLQKSKKKLLVFTMSSLLVFVNE